MDGEPQFGEALPGRNYIERPGAYALVLRDGSVLVVATPSGYFLPGGGVDAGESLEDALARELQEEAGLSVSRMTALGTARQYVIDAETDVAYNKLEHFFIVSAEPTPFAPAESDHVVHWVAVDDALASLREPAQAWAVALAFSEA